MTHVSTCPLCEAACGILVDVDQDRVHAVRGDPDDPFSQGYVCPKASALVDLHHDPHRLRAPLIRDGAGWRESGWDEALEAAARGLRRVRRQHGRDAVGVYYGNPVAHNLGLITHGLPFTRLLRTRHVFSASSTDQLPQMVVARAMYGHLGVIPVPDIDRTDFFLVLGANPIVSQGSLLTAPGMPRRLRALRERGGTLVVVDPRRTETAAVADRHLPIRPGTDALLLAALVHVVLAERLDRTEHWAGRLAHRDRLEAVVRPFSPERVEARTGLAPDVIRTLAVDFARAPRAACYGRVGLCTQADGTLAVWLAQVLNLVTGRVDAVGGMMFPTPAVDGVALLSRLGLRGASGRWRSRPRALPEFEGELPVAALADEIVTPGRGQLRALITLAGNPVLSAPNGPRLAEALARLDHIVAVDPYLNDTTRHAHVVLPPASHLSRGHYDLALYAFAVRHVAKYAAPVVERAARERHDWEILADLGARVLAPRPVRGLVARLARAARPERLLDALLRTGPHGLTLERLRRSPHGLDLGPLEPGRLGRILARSDGRVDVAPDAFVREADVRLEALTAEPDAGLALIGRRHVRDNNSWMHTSGSRPDRAARCVLLMHPEDAVARGVEDGDRVELRSAAGAVEVRVRVTDEVREGVVSLPHGWSRDWRALRGPTGENGVSANDVTSELALDGLSGTAAFNGLPVTVTRPGSPPRSPTSRARAG